MPSLIAPPPQRSAVAARSRPQLELEGVNEDEAQDLLSPLPEGRELSPQRSSLSGPFLHAVRSVGAVLPSAARSAAVDSSAPTAAAGAAVEWDRLASERSRLREEAVAALNRSPGDSVRESAPGIPADLQMRRNYDLNVGLLGQHHYFTPSRGTVLEPCFHLFQVLRVMSTVDDWTFDVFELAAVTNGRPLSTLAFALIKRSGISGRLHLDESRLAR